VIVTVADHAASSEDDFKPDSDKSDNDEDDDDDDELSVVESTSGSSPEESEIETPEKVSRVLSLMYILAYCLSILALLMCEEDFFLSM